MQDWPCTAAIRVGCARAGFAVVQGSRSGLSSVSWPRGLDASLGWQYVLLRTWELIPRSCFRRRREACEGGLVFPFLLIKIVQRRLRTQIQPLAGSALLAFSTPNLTSLTIVVARLSVGLFLLLVECCRDSKLMFVSPFVF